MIWLRTLLRLFGPLALMLGLGGSVFAVWALLGPAHAGAPGTGESLARLALCLALLGVGVWLCVPWQRWARVREQRSRTKSP